VKKIILILVLTLLLMTGGCKLKVGGRILDDCDRCYYSQPGDEYFYKKVCECYNKHNVSYVVDFRCGEHIGRCEGLSFEDKKKMAMIDDSWYCKR